MRTTVITYEEARTLMPIFEYLKRAAPQKEVRRDAEAILTELGYVRQVEYDPLRGHQLVLDERQHDLLERAIGEFV